MDASVEEEVLVPVIKWCLRCVTRPTQTQSMYEASQFFLPFADFAPEWCLMSLLLFLFAFRAAVSVCLAGF